jgi:NAD(P)-dependent dehydrogenase (short-subunit alcohol dehydrogenase family)
MKKNIIIFGGGGLIGSQIIKKFEKNKKYNVIDIDTKNKNKSNSYKGDICSEKSITNVIGKIVKKFKIIHAVINLSYPKNKNWGKSFKNIKEKDLKENLYNQLGSSIILAKVISKYFLKQKYGNLIFFSSIQGTSAPKFEHYSNTNMVSPIEYSATKAGIINITKYLAKYFKGKNIRVNCVSPGGILNNQPKIFLTRYRNSCLSKGMLDSKDLVGLVEFLISEKSKYINGQNIIIDDGWSL